MTTDNFIDETTKIYLEAGMTGKVGFGEKPAILIVDLMKGFTCPEFQLGMDLSEVVESNAILLAMARKKKSPIFFVISEYEKNMKDAAMWGQKFPSAKNLQMGSEQVNIDPRLTPKPEELIITKKFPSSFFGTPLVSYLIAQRIDTLIITGTTTSGCVRATVVDALQYGFRPIVPVECVGDRARGPHEANLFDMGMKYADVIPLKEVLTKLEKMPF
jgi:nicotinamidase-related amidase